jgi:hypothetical protein
MINADNHTQTSTTAAYKNIEDQARPTVDSMAAAGIGAMMAARNMMPVILEKIAHFGIWLIAKYFPYTKFAAIRLRNAI